MDPDGIWSIITLIRRLQKYMFTIVYTAGAVWHTYTTPAMVL
jgi:hypothetical protein